MTGEELIKQWDDYVESMGSVMGEVEHMAKHMRDRIDALHVKLAKAVDALRGIAERETSGGLAASLAFAAREMVAELEAKPCGKRIDPIVVDLKTGWFEPK